MPELTKEQQEDSVSRIKEFSEKYKELSEKLQVDLATYPQYVQLATGAYATVIKVMPMDLKYIPKPSPFGDTKDEPIKKD